MKLILVLMSLLAFFTSSILADFFSDDSNPFDEHSLGFGGGGLGGIGDGFDGFNNDDLLDRNNWKGGKGKNDGKYYVQSWSQVKTKGYPRKKKDDKKILNDKQKWEDKNKGVGKGVDGQKEGDEEKTKKVGGGNDEPFGKGFDEFVGVD